MRSYAPGDAGYHIHHPDETKQHAILAASNLISRLFELSTDLRERELERERLAAESRQRQEQFAAEMTELGKRLDGDHQYALSFQNACFERVREAITAGDRNFALDVLRILAGAPRHSLVQELIAYHEKVTLKRGH